VTAEDWFGAVIAVLLAVTIIVLVLVAMMIPPRGRRRD
jgi:bacteriorhodopsin